MLSVSLFILAVICYQNVQCGRLCNTDDSECLTKAAKKTFDDFISGNIPGVPTSDPLFADLIEGDVPHMKYTLTNTTLSGMRTCTPELVAVESNNITFTYHVACKHFSLDGQYEVVGELGSIPISGKGDYHVDHYDYVFLFTGELERYFDKEDRLHVLVKNYEVDVDIKGKVVYDYKNLYNGDSEKSAAMHKFANENWRDVDKIIRKPFLKVFMALYIKNVNAYMTALSIEKAFVY